MTQVTFAPPPNHRASQSCATCEQWHHSNNACQKFPSIVRWTGGFQNIYNNALDCMVCDIWEPRQDDGVGQ